MQVRWLIVLRDALAIVIASSVVRAVGVGADLSDGVVGGLVLAVFAAGFCVSGCLSPDGRWAHLAIVALASWLILVANGVLTGGADSPSPYAALLVNPTLLGMLVGGAASLAIVRRPKVP